MVETCPQGVILPTTNTWRHEPVAGVEIERGDRSLLEQGIVAYAGHALHDLDGTPVGLISIASRHPLWHPERIESMMQIFAVRAGAEIERLRAEEALRTSEASYRTIFEASEDAVVIHDWSSGALVDLNPKACEMTGYRREEVIGSPLSAFCWRKAPYSERDARRYFDKKKGSG